MRSIVLFFAFISIAGAAGYLQNEDFKTEAELTGAGGSVSQLLNDTKIYVTGNGINKTLDDAIVDGDIGGGGTLTLKGQLQGHDGTDEASVPAASGDGLFLVSDSAEDTGLKYTDTLSGAFNPVTDWVNGTCTSSWLTNTTTSCKYRQIGDTAEIQFQVSLTGAPTATGLTFNLPSEISGSVDEAKLLTSTDAYVIGEGSILDAGTRRYHATARYNETNNSIAAQVYGNSATNFDDLQSVTQASPFTWASGDYLQITVSLPIVGWSSGLNAVIEKKTIVKVKAKKNNNQTFPTATNTTILYNVESEDSHNAYDPITGIFTAPRASDYIICVGLLSNPSSWSSNQYWQIQGVLSVSGQDDYIDREKADSSSSDLYAQGCNTYRMQQGETFVANLRHIRGSNTTLTVNEDFNYLTITESEDEIIKAATLKKCQIKYLSADVTSDTVDIADLRFTGLNIGTNYQVILSPRYNFVTSDNMQFDSLSNGGVVCRSVAGNTGQIQFHSKVCYFTAAATSLTFNASSISASNAILGNGALAETSVSLCEESMSFTTEW